MAMKIAPLFFWLQGPEPAPLLHREAAARERAAFTGIAVLIVGVYMMARLGLNSEQPLPISLAIVPAVLLALLARGVATVSLTRITMYTVLMTSTLLGSLLAADRVGVSFMSLGLFAGLYAMFLTPIELEESSYQRYWRLVANFSAALCVLGVIQYVSQYVIRTDFTFSWRTIVPSQFLIEYNTLNETRWGSGVYKANGFFLLEPSQLSQIAARALLVAVVMLRDPRYAIPCVAAMLVSYSGTGLVLFALFGVVPLALLVFKSRAFVAPAVVAGLFLLVGVIALWEPLNLGLFLERSGEFSDPRSSGFARFTAGGLLFMNFSKEPLLVILFGAGPGMTETFQRGVYGVTEVFSSGWIKMLIDYGVFGLLAFSTFFFYCVRSSTGSTLLASAFLFQFLILDGGILIAQSVFSALIMGALVVRKASAAAAPISRMAASPDLDPRSPLGRQARL